MKRLVDIQLIHTLYGGNFDLDEGCTGKILIDKDNYFEGVVREHGSIADDSFIFGYIEDIGNVDFIKISPWDELASRHVVGDSNEVCYQGYIFETDDKNPEGIIVSFLDSDRTRTVTDSEINKLVAMTDKIKSRLGVIGNAIYDSAYTLEEVKKNVKR